MSGGEDAVDDAYTRALAAHGLEDVQPRYRKLLLRLKGQDPERYESAVARYREDVEQGAAASEDPLRAWLGYGAWLAAAIEPGALMTIAQNGRAEPVAGAPGPGTMLIHLPEAANRRGIVVASPARPSDAQRETAALLCD